MARTARFRSDARDSASKGHKSTGEALKALFPIGKIYQEYPYDLIIKKGYKIANVPKDCWDHAMLQQARRLHADWVVLDQFLIVEFQGEHHYYAIAYGGDAEKARQALSARQYLDKKKRLMAKEANFDLIEIPFSDGTLTEDYLWKKIKRLRKK